MCSQEVVTDRYTVCGVSGPETLGFPNPKCCSPSSQHLVVIYATGNTTDCGHDRCKTSAAHKHRAPNCGCATKQRRPHSQPVSHVLPDMRRKHGPIVWFTSLTAYRNLCRRSTLL
ncbi:hypothetical protein C8R43DRAFT_297448 [Mycena crocata]|nr:hypothetical protein C8R43DRAFT_297448 [Mycena crocata]